MFNRYPYTDAHQLNLDWVIKQVKKIPELAASIPTKLSQLLNDTGFINAAQAAAAAPVQSVNGQTGDVVVTGTGAVDSVNGQIGNVVLTASDVGALPNSTTIPTKTSDLTNDSGFVNASGAAAAAPVQSVNGQTGAVVLDAADVDALEDTALDTEVLTSDVPPSDVDPGVEIINWQVQRSGRTVMMAIWFHTTKAFQNGELLFKFSGIQNALTMTSYTYNASNSTFASIQLVPQSDYQTVFVKSDGAIPIGYYWIFNIMFIMREGT